MGKFTVVIVYVNDIIVIGDNIVEIERLKKKLAKELDIKDLRRLKYFWGLKWFVQGLVFLSFVSMNVFI